MTLILTLDNCTAISPKCIAEIMTGGKLPKGGGIWGIGNELRPANLYCYLQARFGDPNGLQNLFRKDDSDNLIHWEWALGHDNGLILIMGLNMRSEVHLLGDWDFANLSKDQFINYIKRDFGNYGEKMSKFRQECLEHWDIFVNPYHDIHSAIKQMLSDIDSLSIDPAKDELPNPSVASEYQSFGEAWSELMEKYNRAIGLSMGIRSLTPVLAESFINLVVYLLCREDIKANKRLYDNFVRQNIDVKVQSLHIICQGFKQPVDWSSQACAAYNSIVNDRNDLLHGNIVPSKQMFQDIHFRGKVPIFKEYRSMWQQSMGVSIESSGLGGVHEGVDVIHRFEDYVLSCLVDSLEDQVRHVMGKRDLGLNRASGRIGVLLPDHLVDFGMSVVQSRGQQGAQPNTFGAG